MIKLSFIQFLCNGLRPASLNAFRFNSSQPDNLDTQTPSNEPKPIWNNFVEIRGRIIKEPVTMVNGVQSIIVRTTQVRNIYCNHIINVRTDTPIKAKDRVYIAGVLASKTKFLDDRQIIQSFTIKVKRFQLRDGTEVESDINRTKLIGPICSKIKHTDKYSIFTMKFTHTARSKEEALTMEFTNFYRVLVFDVGLRKRMQGTISTDDCVLVVGQIQYKQHKDADRSIQGGYIVATSVQRFVVE